MYYLAWYCWATSCKPCFKSKEVFIRRALQAIASHGCWTCLWCFVEQKVWPEYFLSPLFLFKSSQVIVKYWWVVSLILDHPFLCSLMLEFDHQPIVEVLHPRVLVVSFLKIFCWASSSKNLGGRLFLKICHKSCSSLTICYDPITICHDPSLSFTICHDPVTIGHNPCSSLTIRPHPPLPSFHQKHSKPGKIQQQ